MRKLFALAAAAVLAGSLSVAAPAVANPSAKCGGAPVATGTDGSSSVSVCVSGLGATTAAQKGNGGYIVADGDASNMDPGDGYIGVDSEAIIVCSDEGDYSFGGNATCNPAP